MPYLTNEVSIEQHAEKYQLEGETYEQSRVRIAKALTENNDDHKRFLDLIMCNSFIPAGRILRGAGAGLHVSLMNCFVSGTIGDSSHSIMDVAKQAFLTWRMGGGVGFDFSTLRPRGAEIETLKSGSSGPIEFIKIYSAICQAVRSAGGRRGASMGVLRIDHPDILDFVEIKSKIDETKKQIIDFVDLSFLRKKDIDRVKAEMERLLLQDVISGFNLSVAVTDDFMNSLLGGDKSFALKFEGKRYKIVNPRELWEKIMLATWDYAEPGVVFIDTINKMNNLNYLEKISTTNPCSEQGLPPHGACLLGSFNITKYLVESNDKGKKGYDIDLGQITEDARFIVRPMDMVVDVSNYALPEQHKEAHAKRRMGIGVTGMANALEIIGCKYGSSDYIMNQDRILNEIKIALYEGSVDNAQRKGSFPEYSSKKYPESLFIKSLPEDLQKDIRDKGIRNSHLTSIAPTGTISLACGENCSSGIEPPYALTQKRQIINADGKTRQTVDLKDYAYERYGVKGKTSDQTTVEEHIDVLANAQKHVDSSVSKTVNVGSGTTFEEFKNIYTNAWLKGIKGVATFRATGKRFGVLSSSDDDNKIECVNCDK